MPKLLQMTGKLYRSPRITAHIHLHKPNCELKLTNSQENQSPENAQTQPADYY